MITITRQITPDYENTGNLYQIEVATDSNEEYLEALKLLQVLQERQSKKWKKDIK